MPTLAEIAKSLCKEYKNNNLIIKSDVVPKYKRLSTGCMGMDYPLYGGLVYGRIITFAGQEHSGKSTAACAALAAYQRENPDKTCVYIDVEHALDIQFQALMNNINLEKLYYFNPEMLSGEQILDAALQMQQTDDIGMIILDSLPALVPGAVMENEFTKDMGQRGTIAKYLHKFLNEMTGLVSAKQNILLLINQVRIKGYTFQGAPIYDEPCGDAPKFLSSIKVRFGTRIFMNGEEEIKGADGSNASGFRIRFKITKNKTCACNRGGGFITFDYSEGALYTKDMLDVALAFDFIKAVSSKSYALINLDTGEIFIDPETGKELKGYKKDLKEYIDSHEQFRDSYMEMLKRHMSASNDVSLLKKEDMSDIDAEEEQCAEKQESEVQNKLVIDE